MGVQGPEDPAQALGGHQHVREACGPRRIDYESTRGAPGEDPSPGESVKSCPGTRRIGAEGFSGTRARAVLGESPGAERRT